MISRLAVIRTFVLAYIGASFILYGIFRIVLAFQIKGLVDKIQDKTLVKH